MIKLGFCFSKNYRKANINHMMSSISRIQLIKIWPWLHSNHTFLPCCWSGGKGITSCAEPLPYTVWKNEKKKKHHTFHLQTPCELLPLSCLFHLFEWFYLLICSVYSLHVSYVLCFTVVSLFNSLSQRPLWWFNCHKFTFKCCHRVLHVMSVFFVWLAFYICLLYLHTCFLSVDSSRKV